MNPKVKILLTTVCCSKEDFFNSNLFGYHLFSSLFIVGFLANCISLHDSQDNN